MPELPEIETIKRQLEKRLIGQELVAIKQLHAKSLHGNPNQVLSKKIIGIKRFGKMLVLDVEGNQDIAIHFKMSGQLILESSGKQKAISKNRIAGGHPTADWVGALPSKHTRVLFRFKSGDTLYFNDQRIFGWVKIMTQEELLKMPFLQRLGPEVWHITDAEFYDLIHRKKKAIKIAIMDQDLLSGIGNIYANDGLWEAKINPKKSANKLTQKEAAKLRTGLIKVLDDGIKYGGATAADAKYINLHGLGGKYQEHFRTYDRTDLACLRRDGGVITKFTLGGRGTYFCPICQRH
jgi:formamidopyrimidine-DNA glycosylase